MISLMVLAMAAQSANQAVAVQNQMHQLEIQGPMPAENIYLRPGHKGSDDRMFPDIAIGALRIDGDTLYVRVTNKGHVPTGTFTLIAARAQVGGMTSDLAQARTGRLAAGENRWVAIKGFSVKTASNSAPVFALANASQVSAVARLLPSSAGTLDRSGQGCGDCAADADESNNSLTLSGDAIGHGKPD